MNMKPIGLILLFDHANEKFNCMIRIQKGCRKNSNNTHYQFRRQDNKPIEIYSNAVIDQKLDYLHNNPIKAGIVTRAEDYLYSSAIKLCWLGWSNRD